METAAERVAKLIREGSVKRIAFLTGAGISVAAGIPDFRSAGGMYDTLRPELLTATPEEQASMRRDPTMVVNRGMFQANQFPYLEVRRPFIIGTAERRWKPTLGHFFVRVCADKGLLKRLYTQNIDGLDFHAGVPADRVIPVHGSLQEVSCELCGFTDPSINAAWLAKEVREKIKDIYGTDPEAPAESTNILCPKCESPGIKPSTVMYGGAMPTSFFECSRDDFKSAGSENTDMLIVIGSSLGVYPAAHVPTMVGPSCHRVLINRDPVGAFVKQPREGLDTLLLGDCDDVVIQLATALGWLPALAVHKQFMTDASREALEKALTLLYSEL